MIWPSGIVQTETEFPAAGGRGPAHRHGRHGAGPQALVVPVPLRLERRALRVRHRLHGRRRDGLLARARACATMPDPDEYVRIRADQLARGTAATSCASPTSSRRRSSSTGCSCWRSPIPRTSQVFPDEGMTEPPKRIGSVAVAGRGAPRPRRPTTAGRDVRDRLAQARSPRSWTASALHRIRGYADEHALILDLGGACPPTTRSCCSPAGPTTRSPATTWPRTRPGLAMTAAARCRCRTRAARGRRRSRSIGIPVGRPQTIVVDLAGKWRGPSRRVRIVTSMRDLLGPGRAWAPRRGDCRSRRGASSRCAPTCASAGSRPRSRPTAASPSATTTRACPRSRPGRRCPAATRARATCASCWPRADDVFVVSKPGDEVALSLRRARPAARCPPGWTRTFLLHADGFSKEMDIQLGEPGRRAAAAVPRHAATRTARAPGARRRRSGPSTQACRPSTHERPRWP